MTPRIAVLGTGANGGAIAADLIRAGHDVTLIDPWPENVRAMRTDGLRFSLPDENFSVRVNVFDVAEVATPREPFDLVLLLVKAYDAAWATRVIAPLVLPDGVIVGVQNGMTMAAIADAGGASRTIGCVIEVGGSMFVPGVVERDTLRSDSWFALGGADPASHDRAESVARLLRTTGRVEITDDVASAKWMKLVFNAAELVPAAVPDTTLAAAASDPALRPIMRRAGVEALALSSELGYTIRPLFGHDADPGNPEDFIDALLTLVAYRYARPTSYTTVLQDWHKGRRSEAEDVNGLVVAEAARLGTTTPVNEVVIRIAHRIEAGELRRGADAREVLLTETAELLG